MSKAYFPEIFEALRKQRGLSLESMEEFLSPSYDKLHDPMLLPDMEKARDRVIKAINENEHIVVFSDYDADGIPGAVVMSDFFSRAKYENVSFYIPHRHDEGFGLNKDAVEEIVLRGAKLLITVDCGVADLDEVAQAQKAGVDVIITDHHEQKEKLPKAFAVVNPKRKDSKYPFKEICGSAVAYKLVQAVLAKEESASWRIGIKPGMEKWSLDMVGIATLSDMVPLVDENRIFAKYGLDVLRKATRPGLVALFRKLNMNQKYLTEDDVAFMITPRINAASRMGKPEDAFNLLKTNNILEADKLADHLEKINNERKGIVASLVKEAKSEMALRESVSEVIFIGNPDWRPSLLGLVANSLVEEYSRPVFVWGRDGDGVLKGSCRSYDGINLYLLMDGVKEYFVEYGGHGGAGGFSITLENISNIEPALSKFVKTLDTKRTIEDDNTAISITLDEVGESLWSTISSFAPFGMSNPKPLFKMSNVEIHSAKNFGKTGNHLEVVVRSEKNKTIKAISFFNTIESVGTPLAPGSRANLGAYLEKSYFRNRPELRLRIVDIMSL
ncbi:MAG: single-stranded-DNA-specific exonuclease RecJ [Parcubacteria bacterium C7867-005]|nr:MAG: single-stranded-DNA-specific exonuclease RecJ [Parcubacteria bacterium C7867-005]